MITIKTRKKLIEVALPLDAINVASAREKSIRHGHPSTLHLYWARRPLAAARAVIFAQMVDDPSANPELFPTEKDQDKERRRLFGIIEDLVKWENTANEEVIQSARNEIWSSWRRTCTDNADHPRAKELFDRFKLPGFHDPFAGGGALPLEAQRLGLESHASDLNPVAVLINKAMIEIPPKFSGMPPVNPSARGEAALISRQWKDAQGLADDVSYYGRWIKDEAEKIIGRFYPRVKIDDQVVKERPDLKEYLGKELKVISWIWARTVKSPNPAYAHIDVPLASSFMLSTRPGKEVHIEPVFGDGAYAFKVRLGKPKDLAKAQAGTSAGKRAGFLCIMSGAPLPYTYIREQGSAGRMGVKLMAIVAEGRRGRVYLSPSKEHELVAELPTPAWRPDVPLHGKCRVNVSNYGLETYGDLFTARQLLALTTFADLVKEAKQRIASQIEQLNLSGDLNDRLKKEYANCVAVYLAMAVNRTASSVCTLVRWNNAREQSNVVFSRQALPMMWDFADVNPFADAAGDFGISCDGVSKGLASTDGISTEGYATQQDASIQEVSAGKVVSTDPPYYDNIGYADLSDFYYVWLRRSLSEIYPDLFSTIATPKAEELVATPYRHSSKEVAEEFFLTGMTGAMNRISTQAHAAYPVTIYYAFKQSETDEDDGTSNTGWDTFLAAVIEAGFAISGTWPIRTERDGRPVGNEANALASSIVLVCRKRDGVTNITTRRDFISALKVELPQALEYLQAGNIAPVDLAQAAIGPGMAIFTRYSKVIGSDGAAITVKESLRLINEVLDEQLAEQEGNWDADTRWAVVWFDQYGFSSGEFGQADLLAHAKNTAVQGVVAAGIASSLGGKVRIFKPDELPFDWAPETDDRLTVWEMLHHLIRLQKQGEAAAAAMLARLGEKADAAKELAYRLYGICEKRKRSSDGQLYNDLIVIWPDLVARSKEAPAPTSRPGELNLDN